MGRQSRVKCFRVEAVCSVLTVQLSMLAAELVTEGGEELQIGAGAESTKLAVGWSLGRRAVAPFVSWRIAAASAPLEISCRTCPSGSMKLHAACNNLPAACLLLRVQRR